MSNHDFIVVKRRNKENIFTGICLKAEWNEEYIIEKTLIYDVEPQS